MKEIKVEIDKETMDFINSLPPEEKELIMLGIERIKRNPYSGRPTIGGLIGFLITCRMRVQWVIREIQLFFKKK